MATSSGDCSNTEINLDTQGIGLGLPLAKSIIEGQNGFISVESIIGIPMHWVIYTSMVTNLWGDIWSVPFIPLILISCIVFIASFFAVKKPAKRLQNMSIVENINAQ